MTTKPAMREAVSPPVSPPPPELVKPSHGRGMLRPPWRGSGNPGGRGREYHECLALCRQRSLEAAQKMLELMNCGDQRVEYLAADWIFTRAWGKPKEADLSELNKPAVQFDFSKLSKAELQVLIKLTAPGAVRQADDGVGVVTETER